MPALLLCVLVFLLVYKYKRSQLEKEEDQQQAEYNALEAKASLPIKRPLTDLPTITIPIDQLPFHENKGRKLDKIQATIQSLSKETICNFNGVSNTELKLKYGAGNLNELTEYDQNYLLLVRTLADWSAQLYELDLLDDAITVANFAIECKSDVSKTYATLARIYKHQNRMDNLYQLLPIAEARTTTIDLKKAVYDVLNEYE